MSDSDAMAAVWHRPAPSDRLDLGRAAERSYSWSRALAAVAREIAAVATPSEWGARAVAAVASATRWEQVFLFRLDEGLPALELVAAAGISEDEARASARLDLDDSSLSALAIHLGEPVVSGRNVLPPQVQRNVESLGTPTFAVMPLVARGRLRGTLTLLDSRERLVDGDEIEFLGAVADQLATALESASLFEDSRRREAQALFLSEIADLFGSSLDPDAVLEAVVRRCVGVLGDGCGVFLNPPEATRDDRMQIVAVHHRRPDMIPRIRAMLEALPFRYREGLVEQVMSSGTPLLLPDLADLSLSLPEGALERIRWIDARSCIIAPLRTRRGVLGVLVCVATVEPDAATHPRPLLGAPVGGPLGPAELRLALEVCQRAASALENAHLYASAEAARLWLRMIFQQMADGVIVLDPRGYVRETNAAAVALFGGAIAPGISLRDGLAAARPTVEIRRPDGEPMAPEEHPGVLVLATGQAAHNVPMTLAYADEREVALSASAAPLHDDAGKLIGAVTVLRDVSDLRRLERAKESFLSVASHELRTPLTPLKGLTQILLRHVDRSRNDGAPLDLARMERYLRTMDGQVDRLAGLVNDLLDVSRMKTGRLQLQLSRVDLVAVVNTVLERFEAVAQVEYSHREARGTGGAAMVAAGSPDEERRHRIRFRPKTRRLTGRWDSGRLEQVITNLVTNSLKYSPGGGEVLITLERKMGPRGKEAHLTVQDFGIGIPAGQSAELFRPFSRLANAPAEHFGGLGLGLYIAYDIVERHGGRIWVESEGAGTGATFHVTLPTEARRAT